MSNPKPFCWGFPQGKAVLFPIIVATISFGLSIVVNMSCEYVTVDLTFPAVGGSGSSGSNVFSGGSSGTSSGGDFGCRALSEWSPTDVPEDMTELFAQLSEADNSFNGGLWKYSFEEESDECIPYSQGVLSDVGMPEIDAAFKAARAGGILASVFGFAVAVTLWLNSCVAPSAMTQGVTFAILIFSFIFQGITSLIFLSASCEKVTITASGINIDIPVKCTPSWGLYCAGISAVFYLVSAVGVMVVPRRRSHTHGPAQNMRLSQVGGGAPPQQPQQRSAVAPNPQSQGAANQNSTFRQAQPDGSTIVVTKHCTPEGSIVITKETTFPDGMKKVERTIEHPEEGGVGLPMQHQQQQLQQTFKRPDSPYRDSNQSYPQSSDLPYEQNDLYDDDEGSYDGDSA